VWYFEFEKERMQRKRVAETTKGVGRPKVGGPFELIDQNGKTFTSEMMNGKHSLVSTQASIEPSSICDGV
jgi:protein SCO1/2